MCSPSFGARAGWRRYRLSRKHAAEFVLRKDYRADWESEVKEEGEKDGTEEKIKEVEVTPKDSCETTESSPFETIKPVAVVPKVETSDTLVIKVEAEDTTDVHSVSELLKLARGAG